MVGAGRIQPGYTVAPNLIVYGDFGGASFASPTLTIGEDEVNVPDELTYRISTYGVATTETGYAIFAAVGKEWWIGKNWSLGGAGFIAYGSTEDSSSGESVCGEVIDRRSRRGGRLRHDCLEG